MKINKLSYNAKVFALSVVLVTSSFIAGRVSKQAAKPVGPSVTVEVDDSALSSYCECVSGLIENDKAFADFEQVELDGITYFRLPKYYRLHVVNQEDSNVGMVGVHQEDGYIYYQLGNSVNGDGSSTPNDPKGCLGIHESLFELYDISGAITKGLLLGYSKYGSEVPLNPEFIENGFYKVPVIAGYSMIDSKNLCEVVFKTEKQGEATFYYIPVECEDVVTHNLRIVSEDVKKLLILTNKVTNEIQEEYTESKAKQNIKTK